MLACVKAVTQGNLLGFSYITALLCIFMNKKQLHQNSKKTEKGQFLKGYIIWNEKNAFLLKGPSKPNSLIKMLNNKYIRIEEQLNKKVTVC